MSQDSQKPQGWVAGRARLTAILLPAVLIAGLCAGPARGQAPTTNASSTVAPDAAGQTSAIAAELRDPFWPIGYKKPDLRKPELARSKDQSQQENPEEVKKTHDIAWPSLELAAVSKTLQGKWIAMFKGIGLVEEGDQIRVRKGDAWYRWKITAINEKGIGYDRLDVIPIRKD
ncbi:MAG: hypothetical protein QME60_06630 [Verrucomicrobiota bacterium]|nr:hypothetical protein [Verrucomicrobiota bacterium]